jgi:dTDP-4-dehydrorhamnose reductase
VSIEPTVALPGQPRTIVVTGGGGQLAQALARRGVAERVICLSRRQLDVSQPEAVATIADLRPDLVVNAAAFTDVDRCEDAEQLAYAVNGLGARHAALGAEAAGATLIQVSTDYVFDGAKGQPYVEDDPTHPLSVYGASKLAGEVEARRHCTRAFVARTAWLFGHGADNFVRRLLARAKDHAQLKIVRTQVGSPTYCDDLADALLALGRTEAYGTYHLVNEGHCARDVFARTILRLGGAAGVEVEGVDHFPARAVRPGYAPLFNRAAARLGILLPHWEDALARYLATPEPA